MLTQLEQYLLLNLVVDRLRYPQWVYLEPSVPIEPPGFISTATGFSKPRYQNLEIEASTGIPNRAISGYLWSSDHNRYEQALTNAERGALRRLLYTNANLYWMIFKNDKTYFQRNPRIEKLSETAVIKIMEYVDISVL